VLSAADAVFSAPLPHQPLFLPNLYPFQPKSVAPNVAAPPKIAEPVLPSSSLFYAAASIGVVPNAVVNPHLEALLASPSIEPACLAAPVVAFQSLVP
jgi:hypothetical protein